jgi:hypothetical protein
VSGNSSHIWALTTSYQILYRAGINNPWVLIPGSLTRISVSGDGNHIWGLAGTTDSTVQGSIWYRAGLNGTWVSQPTTWNGGVSRISVSYDGSILYGLWANWGRWKKLGLAGAWWNWGNGYRFVTMSGNGNHVWMTNNYRSIIHLNVVANTEVVVAGRTLWELSVSYDSSKIWGVDNDNTIWYRG